MDWLNVEGIAALLLLLAPNALYGLRRAGAPPARQKPALEIAEGIGRFGCMVLMCFSLRLFTYGYAAPLWQTVWRIAAIALLVLYWAVWAVYFKHETHPAALSLALIPSALFLLSGILWRDIPLLVFAIVFAIAHPIITWRNTKPTGNGSAQ